MGMDYLDLVSVTWSVKNAFPPRVRNTEMPKHRITEAAAFGIWRLGPIAPILHHSIAFAAWILDL